MYYLKIRKAVRKCVLTTMFQEKNANHWLAQSASEWIASAISVFEPVYSAAANLQAAMPPEILAWLRVLPLYWREDFLLVSHAGADAKKALNRQTETEFIWGRIQHSGRRQDGVWIVQGHKMVAQPGMQDSCIFTDTGAWQTGRLSAAWIDAQGLDWIEVQTTAT